MVDENNENEFSQEEQGIIKEFEKKKKDLENSGLSYEEIQKQLEDLKSELLIKICELGEDPDNIAKLIDEQDLGKVVNKFNEQNISPLLSYLRSKNDKIDIDRFIEVLREKGLDPNFKNKDGNTALHLALLQKDILEERLKAFLAVKGVEVNVKNNNGETPLDIAVKGQDNVIAKILIDKGGQLGRFIVNNSKDNKDQGRFRGDIEDKVRAYNEKIAEQEKELENRESELLEEIKKQEEESRVEQENMQKLEQMRIQIKLHHDLKKFFAEELAKLKRQELLEQEKLEAIEEDKIQEDEIQIEEDPVSVAEIEDLEGQDLEDDKNIIEILGQKVDLSDKMALNLLMHYFAVRGDLNAVSALMTQPGADINTSVSGRTVFEAAVDSGNTTLHNLISTQNPSVLANLKDQYKDIVYADLLKDIDRESLVVSLSKDDSDIRVVEEKPKILTSVDDIDLGKEPSKSVRNPVAKELSFREEGLER